MTFFLEVGTAVLMVIVTLWLQCAGLAAARAASGVHGTAASAKFSCVFLRLAPVISFCLPIVSTA